MRDLWVAQNSFLFEEKRERGDIRTTTTKLDDRNETRSGKKNDAQSMQQDAHHSRTFGRLFLTVTAAAAATETTTTPTPTSNLTMMVTSPMLAVGLVGFLLVLLATLAQHSDAPNATIQHRNSNNDDSNDNENEGVLERLHAFTTATATTSPGPSDLASSQSTLAKSFHRLTESCPHRSPQEAYERWLWGWRVDNFNVAIPPPPTIVEWGDEETGVGNLLVRLGGLRESIVRSTLPYSVNDIGDADGDNKVAEPESFQPTLSVTYNVVNPGWCHCFPAFWYEATVHFHDDAGGTNVEWTAEWVPMAGGDWLVHFLVRTFVQRFIRYVVAEESNVNNGDAGPGDHNSDL